MKSPALCSLAAAGIVASGCAALGFAPLDVTVCNPEAGICRVTVNVSDCRVSVDPPKIGLRRGQGSVVIQWRISDPVNYQFQADGIFFKTPGASQEFERPDRPTPPVFTWVDRNPQKEPHPREFNYGVKVKRVNGGDCPPLDPVVVNDM